MTLGRNDPCSCGSGKKYKHCCLNGPIDPLEELHSKVNAATQQLQTRLTSYGASKFGDAVDEAWKDFQLDDNAKFDSKSEDIQLFLAWFVTRWRSDRSSYRGAERPGAVLGSFLGENGDGLSEMEQLVAREFWKRPWSFYEVLATKPGVGFRLRDILTGEESNVRERKGSTMTRVNDIILTQISVVGPLRTLNFVAPLLIPPRMKPEIISLRTEFQRRRSRNPRPLRAEHLIRHEADIRDTYLYIREYLTAPIRLQNTDGDPLVLHTMTFEIESAETAFRALAPLALTLSEDELLDQTELDAKGRIKKVTFEWLKRGNRKMKNWENTILGTVNINERTLIAETNSEKRAVKLRTEIEQRLGHAVVHKNTLSKSFATMKRGEVNHAESSLPQMNEGQGQIGLTNEQQMELADPKIRAKLQQFLDEDMTAWIRRRIPALGGRTPLQAVKDPDGREMVEALLNELERAYPSQTPDDVRPNLTKIRKALKLSEKTPQASESPTLFEL